MNYALNKPVQPAVKPSRGGPVPVAALSRLWPLVAEERTRMLLALAAVLVNSGLNLVAPFILGLAVDRYIQTGQYTGVLGCAGVLLLIYLLSLFASYRQMMLMGSVGQRVLFRLRNAIFSKLQELPVAFFNQNKAGDLISRINNDTDKLNQFLAESLTRFMGNLFVMLGAAVFVLALHPGLGLMTIAPALLLLGFTRLITPWVKERNAASLRSVGGLSAEIQESLEHFKVIVAFNRRDYFRSRFQAANAANYTASLRAGIANNIFTPVYELMYHLAQIGVLAYGLLLISQGGLSVGLLIAFLTYVNRFYDPMRQIAMLWSSFQLALVSWERISQLLALESDLPELPAAAPVAQAPLLSFEQVSFHYPDGPEILHQASFSLEQGKTYAFVGPTGGGKSTTAALMARLYDPTSGKVLLHGRDLRTCPAEERAASIGFILQEPFLLSGTVRDNLIYGNAACQALAPAELTARLEAAGLGKLLTRFEHGLETPVSNEGLSLGQKQLVAFMRAILREPGLLILDEATANIDTVTEQLLEEILRHLPATTTRVIIAHRLNTIEAADEIFFINASEIVQAGSLEHAVDMLLHQQRSS
ncbi:MAG TPA: ABC transporter ATP-binding protein [Candidatus Obscuribacterales bacterium]